MATALGIDIGKKWGHYVLLDGARIEATGKWGDPLDAAAFIRQRTPDVIAIDSPPRWGVESTAGRACEKALNARKIKLFYTPSASTGVANPYYDWMQTGFAYFGAAAAVGYFAYATGSFDSTALEVFPHASAVVVHGCLPPAGGKDAFRRDALAQHDIDASALKGPDLVDAALCALTGSAALAGAASVVGDPAEGVIVVPTNELRTKYA